MLSGVLHKHVCVFLGLEGGVGLYRILQDYV